jgi:hypothetical protein
MMARIRITEEAMKNSHQGVFTDAAREDYTRMIRDTAYREERTWE